MTWAEIITFLFILICNPYAVMGMVIALLIAISAVIFFGVEAITMPYRYVVKTFYHPFRKTNAEVKLLPSIFTFRAYDSYYLFFN
jgi:cell division protein FtsX